MGPVIGLCSMAMRIIMNFRNVVFLAHMSIEGLKSVMVQTDRTNLDATKMRRLIVSQLVQVLDYRSLSLIMRDAEDDGNSALTIITPEKVNLGYYPFMHNYVL